MSVLGTLARTPLTLLETAGILLTTDAAQIGRTPKDPVWTYRKTTLFRYRSERRTHQVPIMLVFALINRPDIFDLRPGNSFVEFLLGEGFDVYLLDWGVPGDEDGDLGIANYVCDGIPWALREVARSSGQDEVTLVGWCMGATMCAMYLALHPDGPARNAALLTMPVDTGNTTYTTWVGRGDFDVDLVAGAYPAIPGGQIDFANKMMKPVTNYFTTYRRLYQQVAERKVNRAAYQAMAKWVAANPPFPSTAYREWITWMYKENALVQGKVRLRGRRVDLGEITQSVLVVTAGADHIAPRHTTTPFLDLVSSKDVTHLARPGGHIGLMAGSKAKQEIWPEIAAWLAERSG